VPRLTEGNFFITERERLQGVQICTLWLYSTRLGHAIPKEQALLPEGVRVGVTGECCGGYGECVTGYGRCYGWVDIRLSYSYNCA
jgi:hypothetical protein